VGRKPRVHEVAAELQVDSKFVLAALKVLDERVKGPSSSLEPPVARKVGALVASGWLPGQIASLPTEPLNAPPEKVAPHPPASNPVDAGLRIGLQFQECPVCKTKRALMRNGQVSIHFVAGERCPGSGTPTPDRGGAPRAARPPAQVAAKSSKAALERSRLSTDAPVPTTQSNRVPGRANRRQQRSPSRGTTTVAALAKQIGVSPEYLIRIARTILPGTLAVDKDSTLQAEAVKNLREYEAVNIAPKRPRGAPTAATMTDQSSATKSRRRKVSGSTPKTSRVRPQKQGAAQAKKGSSKAPAASVVKLTPQCPRCGATVSMGLVTRRVLSHLAKDGVECSGTGSPEAAALDFAMQAQSASNAAADKKAKTQAVANKGKSSSRRDEKAKRAAGASTRARSMSIDEERAVRRARYEDEYGGQNSVRTVRGGLPGLGRRS
jgi:hypothetical protein